MTCSGDVKNCVFLLFLVVVLLLPAVCFGQRDDHRAKGYVREDSIISPKNQKRMERSNALYDSIKGRDYNNFFSRTLARLLIRGRQAVAAQKPMPQLEVSRAYFEKFSGRTIADINIIQANVFNADTALKMSKIEKFVDDLHAKTLEGPLRRNLLFRVGDTVQPYTMAINEELFRSRPYLSTAYFIISPYADDPSQVVLTVFTRDMWAIGGELNIGDNSRVEIYDDNFFGTGDMFKMQYYAPGTVQSHGYEIEYRFPNFFGTFANVRLLAGVGRSNNAALIEADKPVIRPSDHMWGVKAGYFTKPEDVPVQDTVLIIRREEYALWYGYAWNLEKAKGTNFYMGVLADHLMFPIRPEVVQGLNPYYYNRSTALVNVGFSRRNFFQGNMIYGYGRTEDIPYGFKAELVGGMQWNEFLGRRGYLGAQVSWGDMTKIGYMDVTIGAGTFLKHKDQRLKTEQAMVSFSISQFSPLFDLGRYNYLRQFIKISGIWGFDRLWGERELLIYSRENTIHGLRTPFEARGYNRLVANAELVWFTPIFLYHFRFAFFGWGDIGWLGRNQNVFANQMSAAVGIGVRIKNERLIFNNIQLRLGVVLRKAEGVVYNPFQSSWEETLRKNNFTPTAPQLVLYE